MLPPSTVRAGRAAVIGTAIALLASVSWRPALPAADVIINEIHYSPKDKTVREEFVEVYNDDQNVVDLSGWYFSQGIDFTFPAGTSLAPGEYLVVAEDPAVLKRLYPDVSAVVGPFSGGLAAQGDHLVLRSDTGSLVDEVDYRLGFPWPTAGGTEGYSIELIHPALENEVGGNWRTSSPEASAALNSLLASGSVWRYREGIAEASDPAMAWRARDFDESSFVEGACPIGYGKPFVKTPLDMRGKYSTLFLRRTFEVEDPAEVDALRLDAQFDDGFNAWINGVHVAGANVAGEELAFNALASTRRENLTFQAFKLPPPGDYLVPGRNVLAVQLHNYTLTDTDALFDARLVRSSGTRGPTPGARNSVFSRYSPPLVRRLQHRPQTPTSGVPVTITAFVTDPDGVSAVRLHYQVVDPGKYIRLKDPAYAAEWTTVDMRDDGSGGDLGAGDDDWTAVLAADLAVHRRLVRYRLTAVDSRGLSVTLPYPDDPQPNFAYFVYDGVPLWKGIKRPGGPVIEFDRGVMQSLPVYHLIARQDDVQNCQYNSGFESTLFQGTMVYEDAVLDHVEFEVRGEFSTYVSGKNKWRFHFTRGHDFPARDDWGYPYRSTWRVMNFSACASPWVPANRGMAGLDEAVAFRLYALAGVPSSKTSFVQFRVIDEVEEAHPTDQYRGDLWGLYLTIEHTDGRFLEERGLPDGNLYKIENSAGDKRNQGPTQPKNTADYDALRNGYGRAEPIAWWRANVDLHGYYGFRGVGRAINDMDLREGWNVCQYHDPQTNLWSVMPWDLDMLYMPTTHWPGVMNFQNAITQHPAISLEFKNRLRELIDLLFTPDQIVQVVEELAAIENPPGRPLTMVDVDEAMWNNNPRSIGGHRGAFYRNPTSHTAIGGTITRTLVSADHEGMARWIEDFVLKGYGFQQLDRDSRDPAIPRTPTIEAVGPAGFPADGLRFRTGPFSDPQGDATFGALKWRLARVVPQGSPPVIAGGPKPCEIDSVWESGEIATFQDTIQIPPHLTIAGATYRVRACMKDDTARWSRWSAPIEFTARQPAVPFAPQSYLRITEVMYHPLNDFPGEFVELKNVGLEPLDLRLVTLSGAVDFRFADGEVLELAPGELVVVVEDEKAFSARYDTRAMRVAGQYQGRLANGGERILLAWGSAVVLDFPYSNKWWPGTDGRGPSLVSTDPLAAPEMWGRKEGWKESAIEGGSPGRDEDAGPPPGLRLPGDATGDGRLTISDGISLLFLLFSPAGGAAPCPRTLDQAGNTALLDWDGDGSLGLSDPLGLLRHLFQEGPPHTRGARCIPVSGCAEACRG